MINYVCREILYVIVRSSLHCDLMTSRLKIILQVEAAVRLIRNRTMSPLNTEAGWHSRYVHATFPRARRAPQSTANALLHSGTAETEAVSKNTRAFALIKLICFLTLIIKLL